MKKELKNIISQTVFTRRKLLFTLKNNGESKTKVISDLEKPLLRSEQCMKMREREMSNKGRAPPSLIRNQEPEESRVQVYAAHSVIVTQEPGEAVSRGQRQVVTEGLSSIQEL